MFAPVQLGEDIAAAAAVMTSEVPAAAVRARIGFDLVAVRQLRLDASRGCAVCVADFAGCSAPHVGSGWGSSLKQSRQAPAR
jgi:hypothetical protein